MNSCFHCGSTDVGACSCIICGSDSSKGRKAGVCQACRGAAITEKYRHIIDKFDPRKNELWRRIPAHDGTPARRIYLPLEALR